MDSAKLIAVKEVELDIDNDEKAKQVREAISLNMSHMASHSNIINYNWRLIYCVVWIIGILSVTLVPVWSVEQFTSSWNTLLEGLYKV